MHDDDNMSYLEVGAWPEASFYDPTRLGYSAAFVATAWAEGEHIGPEIGEGLYEEATQALRSTTFTE